MSHGITDTDHLVLHAQPAWHGLGTVVEEAPTPEEALKLAKLDWEVVQKELFFENKESFTTTLCTSHVANVRSDNGDQLGVVGNNWRPVQNAALAKLAASLGAEGTVRVEVAGSYHGGRKVWFLLKGETLYVAGKNDPVTPYVLLANGHDGSLALTAKVVTIRAVCRNTVEAGLSDTAGRAIRYLHTKGVDANVEEIQLALGLFVKARDNFIGETNALAAHTITWADASAFFTNVYTKTLGLDFPGHEAAKADPNGDGRKRANALDRIGTWERNLMVERDLRHNGMNLWTAFNAVTEEFGEREEDPQSALFGGPATRRVEVYKYALSLLK